MLQKASLNIAITLLLIAGLSRYSTPTPEISAPCKINGIKSVDQKTEAATKEVISIDPAYVTLFRAEMGRRDIDLTLYNVRYYETDTTYLISTFYKNRPASIRGGDPTHPEYNVEIKKSDKSVLRVFLSR